jgi:hypothetical protein
MLLTSYLDFLEGRGTRVPEFPLLRGVVTGVAGTGKSFCMALLRAFAMVHTGSPGAVFAVAPTGAAAGGIGASTADRSFRFSRSASVYKELDPLELAANQTKYVHAELGMADEISMWGQKMFGHYVRRLDDVLNNGAAASDTSLVPAYGNLRAHISFGDPKQLEPVLDPSLAAPAASSAIARVGKAAWNATNMVFHLDTPVRQNPDGEFVQKLQNLRDGDAGGDLEFWLSRRLMFLPQEQQQLFEDESTMHATCYNKDRDQRNMAYLSQRANTIITKSRCVGTHAVALKHAKGGAASKIPITGYFTTGMMIKLVTNLVPEYGLFNNARGFVRDWFYIDGSVSYDSSNQSRLPVVMVEFPDYTGPPVSPLLADAGKGKWVPIAPVQLRCDCGACHRFGLPLVCAKADSIHSLQGVTIGDTKAIKRVVIHWSQQAESLWAGIFYVAASRAKESHNLALSFNMTQDDLSKIGSGEKWLKQDAEARRLVGLAAGFRLQMNGLREEMWHHDAECRWGSVYDFQRKLLRFIERAELACEEPAPAVETNPQPALLRSATADIKVSVRECVGLWRASVAALTPLDTPLP